MGSGGSAYTASYDASGNMVCRAPSGSATCAGSSPTGALLTYDAERRLIGWQNAPTSPTSQAWEMYDGEGRRVEQYVSGGSGNHTYYLPGNVEEVTPSGSLVKYYSAGGLSLGENTATSASGISYLASNGLGSVAEALNQTGTATGSILYELGAQVRVYRKEHDPWWEITADIERLVAHFTTLPGYDRRKTVNKATGENPTSDPTGNGSHSASNNQNSGKPCSRITSGPLPAAA